MHPHSAELALNRSAHRAVLGARAAVDAGVRVDHVLAITLADRADRAVAGANATRDAIIINHVCHSSKNKYSSRKYKNLRLELQ